MPIRNILASAAGRLGYEAYPTYMDGARPMARRLRQLFELHGIERVIDVGGNRGQYRSFLRFDMGFEGPILSVEPDPAMVAVMRDKAAALGDRHWTVLPCALGRTPGQASFNRMKLPVYNSFLKPIETEDGDPDNAVEERFDVEVRRLDDLLPELGALHRTFVKMDTQGFDLEVLGGGPLAFAQVPLVQTEVSFQAIYQSSPGWVDSIRAFEAAGFRFADLFILPDSLRDGLPLEADCILARPHSPGR